MNKNYLSGRRFEYETMKVWRTHGYACVRASGSHGLYDVISFRPDRPVEMVQCKVVGAKATALRLLAKFKKETIPSKYYHQTIMIKIKGKRSTISGTV